MRQDGGTETIRRSPEVTWTYLFYTTKQTNKNEENILSGIDRNKKKMNIEIRKYATALIYLFFCGVCEMRVMKLILTIMLLWRKCNNMLGCFVDKAWWVGIYETAAYFYVRKIIKKYLQDKNSFNEGNFPFIAAETSTDVIMTSTARMEPWIAEYIRNYMTKSYLEYAVKTYI